MAADASHYPNRRVAFRWLVLSHDSESNVGRKGIGLLGLMNAISTDDHNTASFQALI